MLRNTSLPIHAPHYKLPIQNENSYAKSMKFAKIADIGTLTGTNRHTRGTCSARPSLFRRARAINSHASRNPF
jgi:hypothetical protein